MTGEGKGSKAGLPVPQHQVRGKLTSLVLEAEQLKAKIQPPKGK